MKNSYSYLIQPLFVLVDLIIINIIFFFLGYENYLNIYFLVYVNVSWILIAYYSNFYRINRITKGIRIITLLLAQFSMFMPVFFTYFVLFTERKVDKGEFVILAILFSIVAIIKFSLFYALKIYRELGRNYRNVVFVGADNSTKKLSDFFSLQENFGFRNLGFFSDKVYTSKDYQGKISEIFDFIIKYEVDEIYCSAFTSKENVKKILEFSNTNNKVVRSIPEAKDLYSKNLEVEYYGSIPILKVKELPLEKREIRFFKRVFDIVFSLFIITAILTWLIPLLFIIIKLDSKGSLFFKQKRSGFKGEDFYCYKFRSMKLNDLSDKKQVSIDDDRITKVGKFLRKSSIDELPQFFNVLKGEMSVTGPRPHMSQQSLAFEKEINKYIQRNAVRPGITGLAQVSGYRGEIKKKSDIENRVRLDIFYIENWSFFLDIKIIFKTVFNLFSVEKKAY